jgi:hypothetical protein
MLQNFSRKWFMEQKLVNDMNRLQTIYFIESAMSYLYLISFVTINFSFNQMDIQTKCCKTANNEHMKYEWVCSNLDYLSLLVSQFMNS